jgi:hypothetical protein
MRMSYRDDLTAAQARATAAERELANAREQQEKDDARLGELEASLAAASKELAELRKLVPSKPEPSPATSQQRWMTATVLFLLGIGATTMFVVLNTNDAGEVPYATHERPPPTHDVSKGLEQAEKLARNLPVLESRPFLVGLSAEAVDDKGVAYLARGTVQYDFGVRTAGEACNLEISVDEFGMTSATRGYRCYEEALDLTCSVIEARQRARVPVHQLANIKASTCAAAHCPSGSAEPCCVEIAGQKPRAAWTVEVVEGGEVLFSSRFADDCHP